MAHEVEEIVVRSLGELIDRVTPAAPDPATGRRRDPSVYRGEADARWRLFTSLDRLGGIDPPHSKTALETHILRNFARYSRPHLAAHPVNDWELLVTAQHHGLPTRLLDWSYSPLVAAHFATRNARPDTPCAVWRLDWQRMHRAFDLAPLALALDDLERLRGDGRTLTPWELFGEAAADAAPDFACMLEPPSLDRRIVAQAATFTLTTDVRRSFDEFLDAYGLSDALTKFVIPAERVGAVRDQLDLVGIDERRLFPDLDGVAAELRRYYS